MYLLNLCCVVLVWAKGGPNLISPSVLWSLIASRLEAIASRLEAITTSNKKLLVTSSKDTTIDYRAPAAPAKPTLP